MHGKNEPLMLKPSLIENLLFASIMENINHISLHTQYTANNIALGQHANIQDPNTLLKVLYALNRQTACQQGIADGQKIGQQDGENGFDNGFSLKQQLEQKKCMWQEHLPLKKLNNSLHKKVLSSCQKEYLLSYAVAMKGPYQQYYEIGLGAKFCNDSVKKNLGEVGVTTKPVRTVSDKCSITSLLNHSVVHAKPDNNRLQGSKKRKKGPEPFSDSGRPCKRLRV